MAKLITDQRRALTMLADAGRHDLTETPLIDMHSFTVDALAGLVRTPYDPAKRRTLTGEPVA
jgi:hypothetical protein